MSELKPCPCCGSRLSNINSHQSRLMGMWFASAFCMNMLECGLTMETIAASKEKAEELLIERWNRRAE